MSDEQPKIHIDDDWKSQAAAEKERLAEEVEQAAGQGAAGLEDASFLEIVQTLAMQAVAGLGGMQGPGGQAIPANLDMAKHFIDMLDVLEQKTKGNLDEQENEILSKTVHQLRLAYVETVRGGGAGGPGAGPGPEDAGPKIQI